MPREPLAMTPVADRLRRLAERYASFAADEAHGASPLYERLSLAVAESPELLRFVAGLPADRCQPTCS